MFLLETDISMSINAYVLLSLYMLLYAIFIYQITLKISGTQFVINVVRAIYALNYSSLKKYANCFKMKMGPNLAFFAYCRQNLYFILKHLKTYILILKLPL